MPRKPEWPHFSNDVIERFAHAVDINDHVDPEVVLPEGIVNPATDDDIRRCYALCLRYWEQGVSRRELLSFVRHILAGKAPSAAQMHHFKQMRARYKQLRFAQRSFCITHAANKYFQRTTVTMGKLQDAYKNGHKDELKRRARKLRRLLSWPVWCHVRYAVFHAKLCSAADAWAARQQQMTCLAQVACQESMGGKTFHNTRKIVSQQVAFYDAYRTLYPSDVQAFHVARFLAAINGLMGADHDAIIAAHMSGARHYEEAFELSDGLAWRLQSVIKGFAL